MDRDTDFPDLPGSVAFEQTRLRMPSRTDWIDPMVEFLKQKAVLCGVCSDSRSAKLLLALHEALSNSVVHGNLEISSALKEHSDQAFASALAARSADPQYSSRFVEIVATFDGDSYTWTLTDQGKGFRVEQVLGRAVAAEEGIRASGRGLLIMQAFLDEVRYELEGRRVILIMRRRPGAEKRMHARMPVQTRVRMIPLHSDNTVDWRAGYEAVARNFSQGGVTVVQHRMVSADRVLIEFGTGAKAIYLPAVICHRRDLGADVEEIGCRFVFDLGAFTPSQVTASTIEEADAALGSLIEQLSEQVGIHSERRTNPRFTYTERISIESHAATEPTTGFARDLSKGGMAFIVTTPLPLEARVVGLPRAGQAPLRVRVLILRCDKIMDGFYDVGVCFLGLEGSAFAAMVGASPQ